MCVFQQPMLFNRAPRFLFVATNTVSEERCCTQIRIKYSFWLSPLLFFFLQSILEKLISSNFAIYFSTQSFSTPFERWKITSLLDFSAFTISQRWQLENRRYTVMRLLPDKPKLSTRYFDTCPRERLLFKYQKGTRMNTERGKKNETKPGMNIQTAWKEIQ